MRINYIDVDRFVAAPYDNKNLEFAPWGSRYLVTIQVYNDDGNPATGVCDVYIADDQSLHRIQYWTADWQNISQQVENGQALQTDEHGVLRILVAVTTGGSTSYPGCIFNLYASLNADPTIEGINRTLVCCYATYAEAEAVADKNLHPLEFPHKLVEVPPWGEFDYATVATVDYVDVDVSTSAALAIVVNGVLVDRSYEYGDLQPPNGVKIPYQLMKTGEDNCIVYVVDEGGRTRSSQPWSFRISRHAAVMPDPDAEGSYPRPWWYGAKQGQPPAIQPLTLGDLAANTSGAPGFDVVVPIDPNAQIGDVYRVYLYLNGYDDNAPHTLVLGNGAYVPNAPHARNILDIVVNDDDAKPGATVNVVAPLAWLSGFNYKDAANPGYLWVDYQVNGHDRSEAYPDIRSPIKIDFGHSITGRSRVAEDGIRRKPRADGDISNAARRPEGGNRGEAQGWTPSGMAPTPRTRKRQ